MAWNARLQLHYRRHGERTVAHDRHEGPLRVLQHLYPEGPGICHQVLVHPPGGIVGGDLLWLQLRLDAHSHALLTTPGATRYYRSAGEVAEQRVEAIVGEGARLEWLPLETIAYDGCLALNRQRFELAAGAEMIGWELLALGLPAAAKPFQLGRITLHLELPGVWLERGRVDADDRLLLDSPLGWAGRRVLATMWFASGAALQPRRAEALLDAARGCVAAQGLLVRQAGATQANERVVVLRALADRVEPAMQLFTRVWAAWRAAAWRLDATPPRIWRT